MTVLIMALMIIGIVLCVVEISAPGFGVFGISGIICIFLCTFISWVFFGISIYTILLVQLIIAIIASIVIFCFLKKNKSFNKIILRDTVNRDVAKNYSKYLEMSGVAKTALRPTGDVIVEEEIFEAISLDGYLEKDEVIKVVKIEKNKVFVKKA